MSHTQPHFVAVSDEMLGPTRAPLHQEIQARLAHSVIEREKAALAEVTSPEFAEWAFTPTAFESYGFLR